MIDAASFTNWTGIEPSEDDLDRCNCQLEGTPGHWHCGWNETYHMPNFMLPMQDVEEDRKKRGLPSVLTPVQ